MRLRYAWVAAAVVAADHLTKYIVVRTMRIGESRPVIDGFLQITHIRNPGAAFGMLRGMPGLLALAALIGVIVFAGVIVRRPPPLVGAAAALVAGGALGNLIDRVAREWPFHGTVVDFVDFRFWPAFNIADMAITMGAAALVIAGIFDRGHTHSESGGADTGRHGPPEPAEDHDR